jgi:hypothetical protein
VILYHNWLIFGFWLESVWVAVARSVHRLVTGWTTEGSEFESGWGQAFPLLHIVQTGSGVNPTSYPMGTGGSFPWGQSGRGVKLNAHLQPVLRSRKRGSIHPLPLRLHGEMLNQLSTVTLTTRHPLSAKKTGTNFADKRRSLGRYVRSRTQDTELSFFILWQIVPLLGNDGEISNYTTAVAK